MTVWDDMIKSCPKLYPEGVYFDCFLGWSDIIRDMSFKIENILEKTDETDMYAVQVKEKYGRLRFYMSETTPEIDAIISDAEALSTQTCEVCGHFGKMRGWHHIRVRCDKCFEEVHE